MCVSARAESTTPAWAVRSDEMRARIGGFGLRLAPLPSPDVTATRAAAGRAADRLGWSALRYRPFQLFFLAMFGANAGGFIYVAALGWYSLEITGSPAAVGVAYALNGIPQLLLTIHAGVFTDRFGARAMLAIGIGLVGVVLVAVGVLALGPGVPFEVVVLTAVVVGAGYAIGSPGSLSIVGELVPPGAMSSAVALNWFSVSLSRVVGGLLAGVLLATTSSGVAFVVAGVLNLAPALVMPFLRLRPETTPNQLVPASALLRPVIEAFGYVRRFPTLGVIVVLSAAPGAIGLAYIFLLPTAARELGIGPEGLGNLLAATGLGGLVTGLTLESLQRRFGHGRALFTGLFVSSVALVLVGLAPGALLAIVLLPFVGGGFFMYAAATGTLIQALSPPRLRGRLIGLFALFYWGLLPVGSLIGGTIAQLANGRVAMIATGIGLGTCALIALLGRPQIASLKVGRDGVTLEGRLEGSGAERSTGS